MALNKNNVHPVDPLLTQFAVQYSQETDGFIADKLFPAVAAPGGESGTYYTFSSSKDFFTLPDKTVRAPGTAFGRGNLGVGNASYQTVEDGWEIPVDDRVQANAQAPFDPRRTAIESATQVIMLRREKTILDAITNATTFASYTTALAVGNRYDNDNSEPVKLMDTWKEVIRGNIGRNPNTYVLSYDAWLKLKEHPAIQARIKTTVDTVVTLDLVAKLFGLDRILLSFASYNSSEEGQDISLSDMMSKKAFLGYINPSPGIMRPSVGYTIQVNGIQAMTYREEKVKSEIARASVNEVPKIVAADCGYLITTLIS